MFRDEEDCEEDRTWCDCGRAVLNEGNRLHSYCLRILQRLGAMLGKCYAQGICVPLIGSSTVVGTESTFDVGVACDWWEGNDDQ